MYKSSCTIFNAENGNIQKDDKGRSREEVYISETSISIHERSKEHLAFEVPYCDWMLSHQEEDSMEEFKREKNLLNVATISPEPDV